MAKVHLNNRRSVFAWRGSSRRPELELRPLRGLMTLSLDVSKCILPLHHLSVLVSGDPLLTYCPSTLRQRTLSAARFPNLIPASRKRRSSSPDSNPTSQPKTTSSSTSISSKDRSRPSIATHAKSFRIGSGPVPNPNPNSSSSSSNGLVRTKSSHARQKSSLSVVSTIHDEDDNRDEDVDVFGTSSDAELAGRDRPRGLFYKPTGKTPGKASASGSKGSLVGVTTEEDSLNRANKEVRCNCVPILKEAMGRVDIDS